MIKIKFQKFLVFFKILSLFFLSLIIIYSLFPKNAQAQPSLSSYTNNTEGTLTDGGRFTQQITISGSNFGTACDGTNNVVKIGTYSVPCANVSTWTATSIVFTVPSATNVYGGTGSNGLIVRASGIDSGGSSFYVYPSISSLVTPSVANAINYRKLNFRKLNGGPRKLIIESLAFYLGGNHFHLMVKQIKEGGITLFMRKMGTGYTNYFNLKYERVGSLFQGPFKAALVKTDAHFIHLPFYIHLNALDSVMPEWRERKIPDVKKALRILETYRWSSHLDYLGKKELSVRNPAGFSLEILGWTRQVQRINNRLVKRT